MNNLSLLGIRLIINGKINSKLDTVLLKHPELEYEVTIITPYLTHDYSIRERLIVLRDDLKNGDCPICKIRRRALARPTKYRETCGTGSCAHSLTGEKGCITKAPRKEEIGQKISASLLKKVDGITIAALGAIKAQQTLRTNGYVPTATHLHTAEVRQKIRESLTGNEKLKQSLRKSWATMSEDEKRARQQKLRDTREARGDWAPIDDTDNFKAYRRRVRTLTAQQPLYLLDGYQHRQEKQLHLDHKVSTKTGWKLSIMPEIIAHISNLQYLPGSINCAKQDRNNSEEITELMTSYYDCH